MYLRGLILLPMGGWATSQEVPIQHEPVVVTQNAPKTDMTRFAVVRETDKSVTPILVDKPDLRTLPTTKPRPISQPPIQKTIAPVQLKARPPKTFPPIPPMPGLELEKLISKKGTIAPLDPKKGGAFPPLVVMPPHHLRHKCATLDQPNLPTAG